LGVSPQHLILRSQNWDPLKELPEIGDRVFNTQKIVIGTIADIFGPKKKPFISIKLMKNSQFTLDQFNEHKGQYFYTIPSKKKVSKSKKGSKIYSKMAPRPSRVSRASKQNNQSSSPSKIKKNKRLNHGKSEYRK